VQNLVLPYLLLLSESYVVAVLEEDNLLFTPKSKHFFTTYTASSQSHINFRVFLTQPVRSITELRGPKAASVQRFVCYAVYPSCTRW